MSHIGKKILSAFIEIKEDKENISPLPPAPPEIQETAIPVTEGTGKFRQHFDKLFRDANIPGPDYFEFAKMIEAMQGIADERARYSAAFAGLSVQGLDKQKLLSTAEQYLRVLDNDAANFHSLVDKTLEEKVHGKQKEKEEKTMRIQQLSQEIAALHQQIAALEKEIAENEDRIEQNTGGYKLELEIMKNGIRQDIEKIKQHIH